MVGWEGSSCVMKQCWMNVTCAFWLKYHSSLSFSPHVMTAPLAPVDLQELQQRASRWFQENPGGSLAELTSPVRRESRPAAAAFTLFTARENRAGRAVGAQPCDSCGRWTSCWCEACDGAGVRPPTAVCTSCDNAAIICRRCQEAGRTWSTSQTQAAPGTIQVRGFVTAEGEWQAVHPPLEVTIEEIEDFEGETIEARVGAWAQATFDATTHGSGA